MNKKLLNMSFEFQLMQSRMERLTFEIPGNPWKTVDIGIFTFNNTDYLCIVD